MSFLEFNEEIIPLLKGYAVKCASFANGDLGELERIELEGDGKLATVEFWSEGWIGIDVYDCACDEQVMNVLLSPENNCLASDMFVELLSALGITG